MTKQPNAPPPRHRTVAKKMSAVIERCRCSSIAGARNAQICQKMIGRASRKAAQRLTQTEVVKGSIGLNVAGFLRLSGKGRLSQWSRCPWKGKVTTKAA